MKKIAIIIGTKAELIKCIPIMLELQKRKINYIFIHTGQHPLQKACEEFGVKKPDYILSKEPEKSTKFWSKIDKISFLWFFLMIRRIKKLLKKLKPDYILYHGDTMSSASAAIASSTFLNLGRTWKNVHLEAGLRSGSIFEPFPEEISRRICDFFSDVLFAVSEKSKNNLKHYSKRKEVINMGNTIVDSAIISYEIAKKIFKKRKNEYALINIHRHENLNSKKRMIEIIDILKSISIDAIWPLHDNTEFYLKKYGLMDEIKKMKNIKITPLVNYFNFIFLLANCKYLVTDGGSIQEESMVFKKPCVILRKRTERQEGLSTGINFLTNIISDYSRKIIERIENDEIKFIEFENPYGKCGLSKEIINFLK
jgi:UDP-N-acetylglucosamine 2-epimerase